MKPWHLVVVALLILLAATHGSRESGEPNVTAMVLVPLLLVVASFWSGWRRMKRRDDK